MSATDEILEKNVMYLINENIKLEAEKAELIELLADINRRIKCGSFNIPMYETYYMTDVENILNKYKDNK